MLEGAVHACRQRSWGWLITVLIMSNCFMHAGQCLASMSSTSCTRRASTRHHPAYSISQMPTRPHWHIFCPSCLFWVHQRISRAKYDHTRRCRLTTTRTQAAAATTSSSCVWERYPQQTQIQLTKINTCNPCRSYGSVMLCRAQALSTSTWGERRAKDAYPNPLFAK